MAGLADIFNLALSILSVNESIDDPNSSASTPATLRRYWPTARDLTLRDFPWACARRVKQLSLAAEDPPPGWAYAYNYPPECLFALAVMPETGMRASSLWRDCWDNYVNLRPQRYPFERMLREDQQGQIIVTDLDSAYLVQIVRVENPVAFDMGLVSASAAHLAKLAGPSLKVKRDFVEYARETYEVERSRAAANDLNEGTSDEEPLTPSVAARE